jgi:hypothetical protein
MMNDLLGQHDWLATVKGKSLRDGLRPPLTAAPRSGLTKIRSGQGDVAGASNKEIADHKP